MCHMNHMNHMMPYINHTNYSELCVPESPLCLETGLFLIDVISATRISLP